MRRYPNETLSSIFTQIKNANSRKVKAKILKTHANRADMRAVLKWGLSPMLRFYVQKFPNLDQHGTETLGKKDWKLLAKLNARQITGYAAKSAVYERMSQLRKAEAELLKNILLKRLKIGVGINIVNTLFPGLITQIPRQGAELYVSTKLPNAVYLSPKVDGIWSLWTGKRWFTRNGRPIRGIEHLSDQLPDRMLVGETFIPGYEFNQFSGILRSNSHSDKELICFAIFDDITNPHLMLKERWEVFKLKFPAFPALNVKHVKYFLPKEYPYQIFTIPHVPFYRPTDATIMKYYGNAVKQGYEGLVVKDMYGVFKNKKTFDWMKVKPVLDEEMQVVDIDTEYLKSPLMIGALIVKDKNGVTHKIGKGMSDFQRATWFTRPSLILNKQVTIEYMEKTPDGKLRHASLKGIRVDV